MIDGGIGEGPLLSEVRCVAALPQPQQPKLEHHGRVLFLWCVRVKSDEEIAERGALRLDT